LTESRNNDINVYRLDGAGKKTELYLSTAGILRRSGVLTVIAREYRGDGDANAIVVKTTQGVVTLSVATATPSELRFRFQPSKGSPTVCLFQRW
jgi:hypothetical protein